MRIWSFDLIEVLPKKQLLAMRYELGDMIKQYPNIKHGLVKFANNYPIVNLKFYFDKVIDECKEHSYNMSEKYNQEILKIVEKKIITNLAQNAFFKHVKYNEDNDRYLKQCYYNLQEKYDRGIISEEEWQKIEQFRIKKEDEITQKKLEQLKEKMRIKWDGENDGK